MNKSKKVRQYIAGILSVATVLGSVYQPVSAYSAEDDTGKSTSVVITEGDTDNTAMQSVSQGSVSGNGEIGNSNSLSVSGSDNADGDKLEEILTVSGSDAQYVLDDYFTGETYVAIRNKSTSQVEKMRSGDAVSMDLAWDIDADVMGPEGIAAFTYNLPTGVAWEESEGNLGNGTYRLADGSLSIYYDMAQAEGHINAHLYVGGCASTYALADAGGDIHFPDGSNYVSYDESERLAAIEREWAERGLLPYENYSYGDPSCSNNELFDRHKLETYSAADVERLDTQVGEVGKDAFCMYSNDLAEIIRMAEDGMDLERFFAGTIMQGLGLAELYEIHDAGYSIDDVVDILLESSNISPYAEGRVNSTLIVQSMVKYTGNLGVIPQFSVTKSHGPMWMNTTSEGRAWCLKYGGSCSKGYTYALADPYSILDAQGIPLSDVKIAAIKAVAEMHDIVGGSEFDYQVGQILTWYILNNNVSTSMDVETLVWPVVRQAIANTRNLSFTDPILSDTREYHGWTVQWFECFRVNMGLEPNPLFVPFPHRTVTLYFWKPMNDDGNKQPLLTWESAENEPKGSLYCTKLDENGNYLAGCKFRIYDATMTKIIGEFTSISETKKIILPAGTYNVREISAPEGYNIDPKQYRVTIAANTHYEYNLTVVDTFVKPEVEINKYEDGTNVRVRGYAVLQVYKKVGNTIGDLVEECFVGQGGSYNMRLDPGDYILREKISPDGYLKAADVAFTVPDKIPSTTVVNMYDKYTNISIAKKDAETNGYVENAELALYHANENFTITSNTPYARWTTDGHEKRFERIPVGNYVLRELSAPDDYIRAADVHITVDETEKTQYFTMINNKRSLSILKVDEETGEPLYNVGLELWTLDENKQKVSLISKWTTSETDNPHKIDGVNIGVVYGLFEVSTPVNYESFGMKEIVFGHQHDASCFNCSSTSFSERSWTADYFGNVDDNGNHIFCVRCGSDECAGHHDIHHEYTCNGCGKTYDSQQSVCTNTYSSPQCGLQEGDIQNQVITVKNKRITDEITIEVDKFGPDLQNAYATSKISGAQLELRDTAGNVVAAWTTDGTTKEITDIKPGIYTLVEVKAPDGYVKAEDVVIEVKDTFTTQYFSMYDDDTELKIRKIDENGKSIQKALLQIYYANADGSRGAKYGGTFESGVNDYDLRGIPVGKYILVEERAPEGYAIADPVPFEVLNTADVQTVTMIDKPILVEISKQDITTGEEISGAQLTIWKTTAAGQKYTIYKTWTTDGTPYMIEQMPAGKYILEESIVAAGYVKAAEIPFTVTATEGIQRVTMYDDYTRVEIDKLNNLGTEVPGAKMALVAIGSNGVIQGTYASWTTGETSHSLDHVPAGKYILMEVEPPKGYLAADPITIEIRETTEIQRFMMKDEFYHISLRLEKIHGMTGEHLDGNAEFELYEWNQATGSYELSKNFRFVRKEDGTYSVTSSYAWAEDGELYWTPANQGKFYYKESKAPAGYIIDPAPVYINVLDYDIVDDDNVHHAHNSKPADYFISDNTKFAERPWQLKFDLKKVDAISGNVLSDEATFALYEWSEAAGGYIVSPHYRIVRQGDRNYRGIETTRWRTTMNGLKRDICIIQRITVAGSTIRK